MNEDELLKAAWQAREKAHAWKSGTKVGCAILTEQGQVVSGWNVEGLWMTSIHAEVCAVLQLAGLDEMGTTIVIVTDAKFFTPCGSCLDWLWQFCWKSASVIVQNTEQTWEYQLRKLMPHCPIQ